MHYTVNFISHYSCACTACTPVTLTTDVGIFMGSFILLIGLLLNNIRCGEIRSKSAFENDLAFQSTKYTDK